MMSTLVLASDERWGLTSHSTSGGRRQGRTAVS